MKVKQQFGLHYFSVRDIPLSPHRDLKTDAAESFGCTSDEIHEVQLMWRQPQLHLLIVGANKDNLHLIVNHKERKAIDCLVIGRDISGLNKQWLKELLLKQYRSPQACLLRKGRRLDHPDAFLHLQDFEEVDLVRAETVTLRFLHRLSQCSERVFYVECSDTDYVREVKEKFLQVFALEGCDSGGVGSVWLTCGEKVLPDDELLRNIWNPKVDELAFSLESERTGVDLTANDTFHVHFQPADAVLVKLNFKSDARKYVTSESVILVSPRANVQTLRHEVSKVIHKDPHSFKMFIVGKKVEMGTVLEPFLKAANCTVVLEQRPKIQLRVVSTATNCQSPDPSLPFPVALHRYERVEKLKQEVCSRLKVPGYCVDLHHNNTHLNDHDDIRSSRLRNGDTVNALVLPNRIRVSVRLRSHHWEDVVIDDTSVSTVGHLKAFAQAVLAERSSRCKSTRQGGCDDTGGSHLSDQLKGNSYSFSAVIGGALLADSATLREAGVEMNSRVVLIQSERLGYTVDIPGRVPLFVCTGKDDYRPPDRVMAMCDGRRFYVAFGKFFVCLLFVCFFVTSAKHIIVGRLMNNMHPP